MHFRKSLAEGQKTLETFKVNEKGWGDKAAQELRRQNPVNAEGNCFKMQIVIITIERKRYIFQYKI